jgi:hypothetical protein
MEWPGSHLDPTSSGSLQTANDDDPLALDRFELLRLQSLDENTISATRPKFSCGVGLVGSLVNGPHRVVLGRCYFFQRFRRGTRVGIKSRLSCAAHPFAMDQRARRDTGSRTAVRFQLILVAWRREREVCGTVTLTPELRSWYTSSCHRLRMRRPSSPLGMYPVSLGRVSSLVDYE